MYSIPVSCASVTLEQVGTMWVCLQSENREPPNLSEFHGCKWCIINFRHFPNPQVQEVKEGLAEKLGTAPQAKSWFVMFVAWTVDDGDGSNFRSSWY